MAVNITTYNHLINTLPAHVTLLAVSKTKPASSVTALYNLGQRHFAENYVQELVEKQATLPTDIHWHFIGHLQSNKVKYIAPFVYLIHGIDSFKLLQEVNKQAQKNNRIINVLLQLHIAQETTKFGFSPTELHQLVQQNAFVALTHINVCGLMAMASFVDNITQLQQEFSLAQNTFTNIKNAAIFPNFNTLSMGMSADYELAITHGSTMVRIGSSLFGARG
jgi:PLP dependent protein